ncbi:MAG: hypothetical protein AABW88_01585 [Nanoarchaeota archaeon]
MTKHNWEFKFSRLSEDHLQELHTYRCKDCEKIETRVVELDAGDRVDEEYQKEKDSIAISDEI